MSPLLPDLRDQATELLCFWNALAMKAAHGGAGEREENGGHQTNDEREGELPNPTARIGQNRNFGQFDDRYDGSITDLVYLRLLIRLDEHCIKLLLITDGSGQPIVLKSELRRIPEVGIPAHETSNLILGNP